MDLSSSFTHITLNAIPVMGFHFCCTEAINLASKTGIKVSFMWEGVYINVTGKSDVNAMWDRYRDACSKGSLACFGEGW